MQLAFVSVNSVNDVVVIFLKNHNTVVLDLLPSP